MCLITAMFHSLSEGRSTSNSSFGIYNLVIKEDTIGAFHTSKNIGISSVMVLSIPTASNSEISLTKQTNPLGQKTPS